MSAWFSRLKREREARNLTATQYLVLCELGRFDGYRFGVFPSHALLAARVRCGISTVRRALQAARALGLVDWTTTRVRAAWRSLRGANRYVLKIPSAAVQWHRRTDVHSGRGATYEEKKAPERSSGTLAAMLEAARGLPDLLKARREVMEARWRSVAMIRCGVPIDG